MVDVSISRVNDNNSKIYIIISTKKQTYMRKLHEKIGLIPVDIGGTATNNNNNSNSDSDAKGYAGGTNNNNGIDVLLASHITRINQSTHTVTQTSFQNSDHGHDNDRNHDGGNGRSRRGNK